MAITDLSLQALSAQLASRGVSSAEATAACLARIRAVDPRVRAFLAIDEVGARAMAKASDERRTSGRTLGPLDGVPVALKDIFCQEGVETTAASKILEGLPAALRRHGRSRA